VASPAGNQRDRQIQVDGASVGAVTTYTFTNVQAAHTLSATFALNTFTLTYTAGANGSITGNAAQTVNAGASGTAVTPVANANYHFVNWSDGSTANPRTDTNVQANLAVTANFAIDTFVISASTGANGSISPNGSVIVNAGANQTFTITPTGGYSVSNVLIDGSSVGAVTTYTFNNVQATHTIVASFAIVDTTPTAFALTDVSGATRSTIYTSNTITVAGINTAAPISITGGEYAINGGAWVTVSGTVALGDTVQVRLTSSAFFGTATTATLTIGGVSDGFVVTTMAQDISPTPFDILNLSSQPLSAIVTTNTVTIMGMNDVAIVFTTVGTLVKNGSDTGLISSTAQNGDTFAVRLTTSGTPGATINGSLTVGTFTDAFSVTTVSPDTTPDAFVLTDVTGATP
jgi:hypothetical protein